MGEVRELNPGDWLYPHVQVRSYMLVEAGLTGRIVATVDGQSGAGGNGAFHSNAQCRREPELAHASFGYRTLSGALSRAPARNSA